MRRLLPTLMLLATFLRAAEVSFESAMEPESITLGDRVTLSLTLHSSEPATMPEIDPVLHEFLEVLDRETSEAKKTAAGWELTETLTLTSFQLETNGVPIEVFVTNRIDILLDTPVSAKLPFHTLEIASVLSDTNDALMESQFTPPDLRSEAAKKRDQQKVIWILTAVLILFTLTALCIWLNSRKPDAPPPPPRWDLLALQALSTLKHSEEWRSQNLDKVAVRMSNVLREYIEGRFQIRAPESTTEEFLESTRHQHPWDQSQQDRLEDFLTRTDAIKFAGGRPPMEALEELMQTAESFIRATPQTEVPE